MRYKWQLFSRDAKPVLRIRRPSSENDVRSDEVKRNPGDCCLGRWAFVAGRRSRAVVVSVAVGRLRAIFQTSSTSARPRADDLDFSVAADEPGVWNRRFGVGDVGQRRHSVNRALRLLVVCFRGVEGEVGDADASAMGFQTRWREVRRGRRIFWTCPVAAAARAAASAGDELLGNVLRPTSNYTIQINSILIIKNIISKLVGNTVAVNI